jgi:hypothetical protein
MLSSPAWVPQASLLPAAPGVLTDLHQALVDGAFQPCPGSPATAAVPKEPRFPSPETGNREPGTQIREPKTASPAAADSDLDDFDLETLRLLQELLPDLDLTLADLPPRRVATPKNQREISGKNPVGHSKS